MKMSNKFANSNIKFVPRVSGVMFHKFLVHALFFILCSSSLNNITVKHYPEGFEVASPTEGAAALMSDMIEHILMHSDKAVFFQGNFIENPVVKFTSNFFYYKEEPHTFREQSLGSFATSNMTASELGKLQAVLMFVWKRFNENDKIVWEKSARDILSKDPILDMFRKEGKATILDYVLPLNLHSIQETILECFLFLRDTQDLSYDFGVSGNKKTLPFKIISAFVFKKSSSQGLEEYEKAFVNQWNYLCGFIDKNNLDIAISNIRLEISDLESKKSGLEGKIGRLQILIEKRMMIF